MIPVCTAAQVRALDAGMIEGVGLPSHSLMEVASHGAAHAVHTRWPDASVEVHCGPGNNGGDGYAIARWLAAWGHPVAVRAALPPKTKDAARNAAIVASLNIVGVPGQATVVVDALLGTGQSAGPRGAIAEAVATIRRSAAAGATIVSVDVPTGLCPDTGQPLGSHENGVHANLTLTLGRWKPGLVCAPGSDIAGDVVLIDLGFDLVGGGAEGDTRNAVAGHILEPSDVPSFGTAGSANIAKWDRGHVAVRAGGGAAILACHGAFRGGAGLVTLLAPRDAWPSFHGLWPEVMLAEPDRLDPRRHDAVVLGPGLGTDLSDEVRALYADFAGPMVVDADALSILAATDPRPAPGGPRVITPHVAEAARLLGCSRRDVEADRFGAVARLRAWGTPLLKGRHTLIGRATEGPLINPTGNRNLATAGSGDVLAGFIGALLAAGQAPVAAATVGAWHHGLAGERMPAGGTASDLIEALREAHPAS
jgi:ADP-dependent NAD(P)H-hydrate dehydratase / NAD(P)H-hydrate epimerase